MAFATSGLFKTVDSLTYIRTHLFACSFPYFCFGAITLYAT